MPKKLPKRQKVAKAKPVKDQEAKWEEIPVSKTFKRSEEDLDKKRRLQEAAENFVKSGANTKELLSALAAAQAAQRTSHFTKDVTSKVSRPPNSPNLSLEAWQNSNLADRIQDQRCGKDDGGLTPPISLLFNECIPSSDVAAVVAATEHPKVSLASTLSVSTRPAPHPSFGGAAVDPAAGFAHCAFQPTPGHSHCDGQANVPLDAVPTPLPLPLMLVLLARLSSHIVGKRRWFLPPEMHIVLSNLLVRSLPLCRRPRRHPRRPPLLALLARLLTHIVG